MSDSLIFKPYEPKRAYQEIAKAINQAILDKKLQTGTKLPSERSLAQQFKVGRLTVREALRTLETKGLINIKHGRTGGTFVGMPDPDILPSMIMDNLQIEGLTSNQINEARIGLECAIVEGAILHGSRDDLERIENIIEESGQIMGSNDVKQIIAKMIDFHILLGEATHNPPFIMFIRSLMEWARRKLVHWIPTPEEQSVSNEEHHSIFDAVTKKNRSKAKKLMKEHILHVSESIPLYRDASHSSG
jgi:DNA-binding FadR family transcriptional regulator